MIRRSNKPVFWSLFGAGGMVSALIGPMLVFVTGIAVPLGFLLPHDALRYERMLALAHNPAGKLALAVVISLFLFHGCHRFYHCLHDFGIHVTAGMKAACHGFAAAGTALAVYLLLVIGF